MSSEIATSIFYGPEHHSDRKVAGAPRLSAVNVFVLTSSTFELDLKLCCFSETQTKVQSCLYSSAKPLSSMPNADLSRQSFSLESLLW